MAYRAVVFDVDGTLTMERSSWEYVHRRLGIWNDRADGYQKQFFKGEISYAEFCRLDAALWKGMPYHRFLGVINEIQIRPGLLETLRELKDRKMVIAIVSMGLASLADRIVAQFPFDFCYANRLLHDGEVLTGEVEVQVSWGEKGEVLSRIAQQCGIGTEHVVAVGDGLNDIHMFERSGLSIALNPWHPSVEAAAQKIVRHENLTAILPLLDSR
jgi:phosphoserine phosphatase